MEEIKRNNSRYNDSNNKSNKNGKRNLEKKRTRNRTIKKPKKYKNQKTYKSSSIKTKLMKKIATIAVATGISLATALTAYSNYRDNQTTRQAISYENQITDYNNELYNRIQDLKEDGLDKISNEELSSLIKEVNKNNYNAIKDKIAKVIPDYDKDLEIKRYDRNNAEPEYVLSYSDTAHEINKYSLNNSKIKKKLDRYIDVCELIDETENGNVDRSELEEELVELGDEMKKDADIGVYIKNKDGKMDKNAIGTYSISEEKSKIEKKLSEMKKENKNFENVRE